MISSDAEDLRASLLAAGGGTSTLATVCSGVAALLPVTGVSVVLMSPGPVQGVASANDPMAKELQDLEFTLGEGPGIDAFTSSTAGAGGGSDRCPPTMASVHGCSVEHRPPLDLQLSAAVRCDHTGSSDAEFRARQERRPEPPSARHPGWQKRSRA